MTRFGWLALLAVVIVGGGLWWFVHGHQQLATATRPAPTVPGDIAVRLRKVRLHGIAGGKIVWEVQADNIDLAKNRPLWRFTGLKKVAVVNEGTTELTLSAGELQQNTLTKDVSLLGAVTISGTDIELRTPAVHWNARSQLLEMPETITARFGEYALTAHGASYDVLGGILTCPKGIVLTAGGNTLRAGSALLQTREQRFTLTQPVTAELDVADMQAWAAGASLPKIPSLPPGVLQRYKKYCQQHDPETYTRLNTPSPVKGIQP